jgi:Tol biopolymer transport system component
MKDLDSRLRAADQIDVTDLWPDIERRQPTTPQGHGQPHRWPTVVGALVIGMGVVVAFIVAFTLRSTQPVSPATPGPAATNGLIAFSGGPFGGPQILVMQADGSDPLAITSGGAEEGTLEHPFPAWEPAWSPDGSRIAFRGFWGHGESSDLFVMNADGSDVKQLTRDANVSDPTWSPDGSTIAMSAFDGIYTINAGGGDLRRLTPESTQWHNHPSWSPGGTLIAYDRSVQGVDQVFIVGADGTGDRQISGVEGGASSPSWSPDGTSLAFVSDLSGSPDIYVMNVDGTGVRPITTCEAPDCKNDSRPTWAPDGSRLAFDRDSAGGTDIYTVDPDGSRLTLVAMDAFDPAWQPVLPGTPVLSNVALPGGLFPMRLAIGESAVWVLSLIHILTLPTKA